MAKQSIIQVTNLTKSYGMEEAVRGVSFEVFEGEIFGLLGPNGAGKTTTLEIMETLRLPSGGDVTILGHSIHDSPAAIKRLIGVQLQEGGFYPNLTLAETLRLFGDLTNTKVDTTTLLRLVNLEDKARAQVKTLSGGQRQRFAIALTLVNRPKIIFLDEPSTGLDPKARRELWELIRKIRQEGTTVILTTHYMDEAEVLCDRVAIMNFGQIIALDTPDQLIDSLISRGYQRPKEIKKATLEDVFLDLTGKKMIEETGSIEANDH